MAFTVMLGIHVALRSDNSRLAAINTLGTVFFPSVGTMICIYLIRINGRFEYQWLSFAGSSWRASAGSGGCLSAERPSTALNLASTLLADRGLLHDHQHPDRQADTGESCDPLYSADRHRRSVRLRLAAMAVPLMSEFDVAIGRSSAIGE